MAVRVNTLFPHFVCLVVLQLVGGASRANAPWIRFPDTPRVAQVGDGWTSLSPSDEPNVSPAMVNETTTAPGTLPPLSSYDPFATVAPGMPVSTAPCPPELNSCPPNMMWCEPYVPRVRYRVYGEFLYLDPGNAASTSVAVPINGAITPPFNPRIPVGSVMRVEPGFASGFRFGFAGRPNQASEWGASYTYYDTSGSQFGAVDPASGFVFQSLLVHPATTAADTFFLDAAANSSVGFQLVDLAYRRHFSEQCAHSMNFLFGARFANLEQDLDSTFTNTISIEEVLTRISFKGAGIRTGLESMWRSPTNGFYVYGNAYASFLAGRFDSSFTQRDNFVGDIVNASFRDDRIVPVLDLELGLGWRSQNNRWYISGGYMFGAWTNVMSTSSWINGVHAGSYDSIHDTLTFNGLIGRTEYRF